MILDKVCSDTGIRKSLLDAFSTGETDAILALAYYTVCRGKAFSHSEDWLEARGYADLGLTSQRISELLASISDDKQNAFFKSWMARQDKGDSLLFDITSISTYGKGNPWAERGYNRDHENLDQVNRYKTVSVVMHFGAGVELFRHLQLLPFNCWEVVCLELHYVKQVARTIPERIKYRTFSLSDLKR